MLWVHCGEVGGTWHNLEFQCHSKFDRSEILSRRVNFLGYLIAERKRKYYRSQEIRLLVIQWFCRREKIDYKGAEDGEIVDLHIAVHVHIPNIPQQQGFTDCGV